MFIVFAVLWGLNGWFQSMGAPAGVVSLNRWYDNKDRGTYYGIWSEKTVSHLSHSIDEKETRTYDTELSLRKKTVFYYRLAHYVHAQTADMEDINNGYGFLIDRLGCNIIQTDRPAMVLEYLRKRKLHE